MDPIQANIAQELRDIVESFKRKSNLSPKELEFMDIKSPDDLKSVIAAVQADQKTLKNQRYMRRLEPYIDVMLHFGKVIEVFLNASEILCFVWGPLKFLLLLTASSSAAYNSLLETYEQIAEEMPLFEASSTLISESSYLRKAVVMVFSDIIEFHAFALKFFKGKVWKQMFEAIWPKFQTEIEKLRGNLRRHKQLVHEGTLLLQHQHTKDQFKELFRTLKVSRDAEHERRRLENDLQNQKRRKLVFDCLQSPDNTMAHESHVEARSWSDDTCQWILRDSKMADWLDPIFCQDPLLWMHGKPGAGKSVLASLIIEEAKNTPQWLTCFFYFSSCAGRNDFLSMAKDLLQQLAASDETLLIYLHNNLATSGWQLNSLKLSKELLSAALSNQKTFVILDGIDELKRDTRKLVCDWFREQVDQLCHLKQHDIRCLFISQDDSVAKRVLGSVRALEIRPASNEADIEAFAYARQRQIEMLLDVSCLGFDELGMEKTDIAQIIKIRSNGMFIYAKCVLEELEQCSTKDELQKCWSVATFPKGMSEVYDRIHRRLTESSNASRSQVTNTLLSWIALSQRPIRWFELQAMISFDLNSESVNDEGRRLILTAKEYCASFIEVRSDDTIELVHSTAREFLVQSVIKSASLVHQDLCIRSMQYLNFPIFSELLTYDADDSDQLDHIRDAFLRGQLACHDYAVPCWIPHLLGSAEDQVYDQSMSETLGVFLDLHDAKSNDSVPARLPTWLNILGPYQNAGFYHTLIQTAIWFRKKHNSINSGIEGAPIDIPIITTHLRAAIEKIMSSSLSDEESKLALKYYGHNWYKCPNMYCRHFWDGFKSMEARDTHIARHERPFTCTNASCSFSVFGFVSKSQLDTHILQEHGTIISLDQTEDVFPDMKDPNKERNDPERKHKCHLCPNKSFTTNGNLQAHLRTHTKQRPFVCKQCQKQFKMRGDLKRHQAGRSHDTPPDYMCYGVLKTGEIWGCGEEFDSSQDLTLHLKSINSDCGHALREEDETLQQEYQEGQRSIP